MLVIIFQLELIPNTVTTSIFKVQTYSLELRNWKKQPTAAVADIFQL